MLPLLIHTLLSATVFLEQEMDAIRFGRVDRLTGAVATNFVQADIDRDGYIDLLFNDRVLFQRDAMYPKGSFALIPATAPARVDAFGATLFMRSPETLSVYSWSGSDWARELEQAIDWPDLPAPSDDGASGGDSHTLQRFLVDLDNDSIPEIAVASERGVHLYRYSEGRYQEHHLILYRQTMVPVEPPALRLWSGEDRTPMFPRFVQDVSVLWRGSDLYVIERGTLRAESAYFDVRRYDFGDRPKMNAPEATEYSTGPLSEHARPVFLDSADRPKWVHIENRISRSNAFPTPISELVIANDAGTIDWTSTSKARHVSTALTDFDGDNDLDVVREWSGLAAGGLRESLNRAFFQREVPHRVEIYLQTDGVFSAEPEMQKSFRIHLDHVPYRASGLFRRYQAGRLINLTGDFNGDRHKDLLFQELPDRIVIYLQRLERFSKHAINTLSIEPDEEIFVYDIDGNGLSDVALVREDAEGKSHVRVFFARRAGL